MTDNIPQHVVITGVSRGLGQAMAQRFAKAGSMVDGISKDSTSSMSGIRIHNATVTSPIQMAKAVEQIGRVPDIVIANAGTINERRPAWEIPTEEWSKVMDVNLMGVVETARVFLPQMIAAGRGLFVAMSSGWGRSAASGLGPYCASKFAVEGLVGTLNDDLPDGVCAIALDPGNGINTDMLAQCLPEEHGRYIGPQEWADFAVADIMRFWREGARGSLTVNHPGLSR